MRLLRLGMVLGLAGLAAAILAPPARAQSTRYVPQGFCALSSLSAAVGLSSCSGGIPAAAGFALICAYAQAINYRDDGVAPTGTAGTGGQGISAGQCIWYSSALSQLQFIQQAGGAILGVSFYSSAGQ